MHGVLPQPLQCLLDQPAQPPVKPLLMERGGHADHKRAVLHPQDLRRREPPRIVLRGDDLAHIIEHGAPECRARLRRLGSALLCVGASFVVVFRAGARACCLPVCWTVCWKTVSCWYLWRTTVVLWDHYLHTLREPPWF